MKKIVVSCLLLVAAFIGFGQTQDTLKPNMVLRGNYQEKNIYIQNPFAGNGLGFCVTKVVVNGTEIDTIRFPKFEMYSSAFEIDLKSMGFKSGDTINVQIFHKNDCKPKVLNDCIDCGHKSTFDMVTIEALPDGTIKWTTKNEIGKIPYVVEQFRWNKWVKAGEVDGKGGDGKNSYETKITPHSGTNKIRIKQIDYSSQPRYSKQVEFISEVKEVEFSPIEVYREIVFTSETMYEIYDNNGDLLKKGFGKTVDCSGLPKTIYYMNYDNKLGEFIKMKNK